MQLNEIKGRITLEYFSLRVIFALNVRAYQLEGVYFMGSRKKTLLADDMGLGKTLQILAVWRITDPDYTLIVCSKNALATWRKEFKKWLPDMAPPVIISGQKQQRRKQWKRAREVGIGAVTSATLRQDIEEVEKHWEAVIGDEVHRFLRNHKTATFKAFKRLKCDWMWLASGTPSSRGPQQLFGIISILRPQLFTSFWRYISTFHEVDEGPWGKEIGRPRNMEQFHKLTGGFILRRKKKDVLSQLPPKNRIIECIDMTPEQEKLYHELSEDMIAMTGNELVIASTSLAKLQKLRQLLVCPKTWDPKLGYGAVLEWIKEHYEENEYKKGVIFTPYPSAFPFIEQFVREEMGIKNVWLLRGGISVEEQHQCTEDFRTAKEGIVLVSIKFAESFELETAQVGYFNGFEYDPFQNYQAEDRIYRGTIAHGVDMFYFRHNGAGVDEEGLDIVSNKVIDCRPLFRSPKEFQKLLLRPKDSC